MLRAADLYPREWLTLEISRTLFLHGGNSTLINLFDSTFSCNKDPDKNQNNQNRLENTLLTCYLGFFLVTFVKRSCSFFAFQSS